uniref:Uncharacterized protein n=1 Tax=Thermosporothrix sp. COM3 TaxID=2490863 RepID=A0A455SI00_9CHLR|nr:hypothetical protein KTC_19410 [Thermosporothrix sp. COM3]
MYQRRTTKKCAQNPRIHHFSLQGLPAGHTLALNLDLGTLSYLVYEHDTLRLLAQEYFCPSELSVLSPLLEQHPYFCPYEHLYACYYYSSTLHEAIERARHLLLKAAEEGKWDQEIRPIRDALSRTRIKLRSLGLDVLTLHQTGYLLHCNVA